MQNVITLFAADLFIKIAASDLVIQLIAGDIRHVFTGEDKIFQPIVVNQVDGVEGGSQRIDTFACDQMDLIIQQSNLVIASAGINRQFAMSPFGGHDVVAGTGVHIDRLLHVIWQDEADFVIASPQLGLAQCFDQ